jgi:hypothetical protein
MKVGLLHTRLDPDLVEAPSMLRVESRQIDHSLESSALEGRPSASRRLVGPHRGGRESTVDLSRARDPC